MFTLLALVFVSLGLFVGGWLTVRGGPFLYVVRYRVVDFVVVFSGVLPRYLFDGIHHVFARYLSYVFQRSQGFQCDILCGVHRFEVIMVQTVSGFRAVFRLAMSALRQICPRAGSDRVDYCDECVRYCAFREYVPPEFVVKEVGARIVPRRRVVVFRVRSAVLSVRVAECGCCFCLEFHQVKRSRVLRRVGCLVVARVVRPVYSGQALRQDYRVLFTFRAFRRVLAEVPCPA